MFQSSADWLDARFGLHCLKLARWAYALHVLGALAMYLALLSSGARVSAFGMLVAFLPMVVIEAVAVARIATVERRAARTDGAASVPEMRGLFPTFMGMVGLTVFAALAAVLAFHGVADAWAGHGASGETHGGFARALVFVGLCLQPVAVLYAGCEGRRLHRPPARTAAPMPEPA